MFEIAQEVLHLMTQIRFFLVAALLAVSARGASAQTNININCGGKEYVAIDGTRWIEDYYFTGGDLLYTSDAIVNSQDLPLYRSGRAGLYGDFVYNIPVANGSYNVTLHFAEIQYWNKGDRIFNVVINGAPALTNFDILANAAPRAAYKQQFPVTVTNGTLQIAVNGVFRKGILNGIQIGPGTMISAPSAPALHLSGNSLTFGGTTGGANPAARTVAISNAGTGTLTWTAAGNQPWLAVTPASGTGAGTLTVQPNLAGLAAGTYNGTVTVTAATATGSPQVVAVALTVAPPASAPALALSGSSLTFTATAGAANPAAQTIAVSNSGTGALTWTAGSNQTWLAVSPASGSGAATLSVQPNLTGMAPGTYTGVITVTAPGAAGSPKTVAVSLTVAALPSLAVSSSAMTFNGASGGANPAPQTASITNTGTGTLTWSATSNQTWLAVTPASGSGAATLSVQPNLAGMAPGTYSGAITVTAPGAAASPKTIAVSLTVTGAPSLSVSGSTMTFNGTAGGANPAPQTVTIANAGTGTLTWSASSNQTWLAVTPASGSGAGTLSVQPNLTGMAPGTYTGAIAVTAPGAAGSPNTVSVTMTVAQPVNTQAAINVNCGGNDYTAIDGTKWVGDYYFTGGDLLYTSDAIVNSQDMPLYRSARAGLYGDFSYAIPVQNGSYTVTLHFAEIQYWNRGDRVFNVAINGATVLNNFDILAQTGARMAFKQQFPVNVTNGKIQIDVNGVVRKGILSGIQIATSASTPIAPPSLVLSSSALSFSATAGGSSPAAQPVAISNGGSGALAWTASSGQGWLAVSPSSGSGPGTISIQPATGSLAAGTYTGSVTVSASGAAGSPKTIAVTFTVAAAPPPVVTLAPSTLSFSGTAGGSNPAAQSVSVSNGGSGAMSWTAAGNAAWLTVSPASGTNSGTIGIGANLSGLAAGSYSSAITVSAAGATPATIGVTLTVTAPTAATVTASPSSVTLNATAGSNPVAAAVSIGGTGNPAWTAGKTQSWLTLSQTSGTGAATISIGATAAAMTAGTYNDTVTISGGSNPPVTVAVTLVINAAVQPPTAGSGNTWYVSPNGSAGGNGSISNPWDIATALNQPASVRPGDTIYLRAGKYGGGQYNSELHSYLVGTPVLPITVRSYPGERAIIDAWLQVGCCDGSPNAAAGSYTWFWGLEFASYNPNRTSGTSGPPEWAFQYNHQAVDVWGAGTKFINCVVHDTAGGISVWNAAGAELVGNIVYNIGGYGTDRGHGHDYYLQNQAPSVLTVTDNIGFNNFDMGLQAYGSSDAYVQNFRLKGNIIFNSGVLYGQLVDNLTIGGGNGGPSGMLLDNNFFYDTPGLNQGYNELGFLWTARAHDAVVTNNYFIGGNQGIALERWDTLTFQNNKVYSQSGDESMLILRTDQTAAGYNHGNNQYYGSDRFMVYAACDYWPCPSAGQSVNFATWMAVTGLDKGSTLTPGAPTGSWTAVRPNQYEPGRANLVIYNWDLKPSVAVDLSASGIKVGDRYQIRDVENWYNGAVVSGTYTGAPVSLPMSGLTVAQPFGSVPHPPSHTAPQFGVFVLLSGNAMNVF